MTIGKIIALTRRTFVGKVVSLLFNMLSRLVITLLPRGKLLLISWLQSPSAMILEPKKRKSATVSTVSQSIWHEVMGPDAMILVFWMLNFKPTFSLSSFTFIKRLFSSCSISAIRVVSSAYLRLLIFFPAVGDWRDRTPVLLPGKSHGWRNLEGCSPWGCWGSDMTERLHFHFSLSCIGEGKGNPLQCSCLDSPRDGAAWWAAVYGVAQSRTWLKWLSSSSSLIPACASSKPAFHMMYSA